MHFRRFWIQNRTETKPTHVLRWLSSKCQVIWFWNSKIYTCGTGRFKVREPPLRNTFMEFPWKLNRDSSRDCPEESSLRILLDIPVEVSMGTLLWFPSRVLRYPRCNHYFPFPDRILSFRYFWSFLENSVGLSNMMKLSWK